MKNNLPEFVRPYQPALELERILSRRSNDRVRFWLGISIFTGSSLLLAANFLTLPISVPMLFGGTLICIGLYTKQSLLLWYFDFYYYQGLSSYISSASKKNALITYDVAKVLAADSTDLTKAVLSSTFGQHIYVRAGLRKEVVDEYLAHHRPTLSASSLPVNRESTTTLLEVIEHILVHDSSFKKLLAGEGISFETFWGASQLVMNNYYETKRSERWWSRDYLSKQRNALARLGAMTKVTLPYTSLLAPDLNTAEFDYLTGEKVKTIETLLAAKKGSNVLLIGDTGLAKDALAKLAGRILKGRALNSIVHLDLLVLDLHTLILNEETPEAILLTLEEIASEARKSGRTTFIIPQLDVVMNTAKAHHTDILELMEDVLIDHNIHLICLTTNEGYDKLATTAKTVLTHLTPLTLSSSIHENILTELLAIAPYYEDIYQIIYTYESLVAIASLTETKRAGDDVADTLKTISLAAKGSRQLLTAHDVSIFSDAVYGIKLIPRPQTDTVFTSSLNQHLREQTLAKEQILSALKRQGSSYKTNKPQLAMLLIGNSPLGDTGLSALLALHPAYTGANEVVLDGNHYRQANQLTEFIQNITKENSIITIVDVDKIHKDAAVVLASLIKTGSVDPENISEKHGVPLAIIATTKESRELIAKTADSRLKAPWLNQEILKHLESEGHIGKELLSAFVDTIIFEAPTNQSLAHLLTITTAKVAAELGERGIVLIVPDETYTKVLAQYQNTRDLQDLVRVWQDALREFADAEIIQGHIIPPATLIYTKTPKLD